MKVDSQTLMKINARDGREIPGIPGVLTSVTQN